jgi:hypothetical protein
VEPTRALADLLEISPQIEAAAIVHGDGETAVAVGVPPECASDLGRAARELLARAGVFRSDGTRVTQIHAELGDGDVFAVAGADGRAIVATVSERTASGLVFYDLKRCLAAVEEADDSGT